MYNLLEYSRNYSKVGRLGVNLSENLLRNKSTSKAGEGKIKPGEKRTRAGQHF